MDILPKDQVEAVRHELEDCRNPLFFFHDDADGLASFLLFYRFVGNGKGVVIKKTPKVTLEFARKAEEHNADKVFILDLAMVDQEFIDAVHVPIIWIDHHAPLERYGVKYYNPRLIDPANNVPCSRVCYEIVQRDLWIGMVGTIADWFYPADIGPVFSQSYGDILPPDVKDPEIAMFETTMGRLVDVFSFLLKGSTTDCLRAVKVMTRIDDPYDILNQSSPKGKYIYKKYMLINEGYQKLIKKGSREYDEKDRFFVFIYSNDKMSYSQELANFFLHKYPDKIILIGRRKSGEIKASVRSRVIELPAVLLRALEGISGFGGGHEHACGTCVKEDDFPQFLEKLRLGIAEQDKLYKGK